MTCRHGIATLLQIQYILPWSLIVVSFCFLSVLQARSVLEREYNNLLGLGTERKLEEVWFSLLLSNTCKCSELCIKKLDSNGNGGWGGGINHLIKQTFQSIFLHGYCRSCKLKQNGSKILIIKFN